MSNIIWKDNGEPARKVGSWPFTFTVPAQKPTRWAAFHSETGHQMHLIIASSIGFNVRERNGELQYNANFMTLEQAQQFCEATGK